MKKRIFSSDYLEESNSGSIQIVDTKSVTKANDRNNIIFNTFDY